MNREKAQQKLNKGYGKLANSVGREFSLYRALTAMNPISEATLMGTLNAFFDSTPDFMLRKVSTAANPIMYGAFDATNVMTGDYLVGEKSTYIVGVMQDLMPIEVFECNHTVNIYRPTAQSTVDPNDYYEGNTVRKGLGALLAAKWPCSIIQGTKGDKSLLDLPDDTRSPWFSILLPDIPGLRIQTTDHIVTDYDETLIISSVEHTAHGLRLTAGHSEA